MMKLIITRNLSNDNRRHEATAGIDGNSNSLNPNCNGIGRAEILKLANEKLTHLAMRQQESLLGWLGWVLSHAKTKLKLKNTKQQSTLLKTSVTLGLI